VAIFVMNTEISELAARGCCGIFARHALRDEAVGELLQMLANFIVDFDVLVFARFLVGEEAAEFCGEDA
jgi:hypothetical protein